MGSGTFVGLAGNAEHCNVIQHRDSAAMDMALGMKALGCLVGETFIQNPPRSMSDHITAQITLHYKDKRSNEIERIKNKVLFTKSRIGTNTLIPGAPDIVGAFVGDAVMISK